MFLSNVKAVTMISCIKMNEFIFKEEWRTARGVFNEIFETYLAYFKYATLHKHYILMQHKKDKTKRVHE